MKNMDKELTVPKWLLINRPKIPQMPQNSSAQIFCPSPEVWNFDEKRLHWASVVRDTKYAMPPTQTLKVFTSVLFLHYHLTG